MYTAVPHLSSPGTGFVEDSFSMDWGGGWFWKDSSMLHSL